MVTVWKGGQDFSLAEMKPLKEPLASGMSCMPVGAGRRERDGKDVDFGPVASHDGQQEQQHCLCLCGAVSAAAAAVLPLQLPDDPYLLLGCGSGNVRVVGILDAEGQPALGAAQATELSLQPYQSEPRGAAGVLDCHCTFGGLKGQRQWRQGRCK